MKFGLFQLNPIIGAIEDNTKVILSSLLRARHEQCDIIAFPELALCGYPPRDLLLDNSFLKRIYQHVNMIAKKVKGELVVLGGVKEQNGRLYNGAYLISKGKILRFIGKKLLPTYDVFDESRYFTPFEGLQYINFRNHRLGISICEDIWNWPLKKNIYRQDPIADLKKAGIDYLINISASPFSVGKPALRHKLLASQAKRLGCPILYVNQVGGNDELVFDGQSMIYNKEGDSVVIGAAFKEDIIYCDSFKKNKINFRSDLELLSQALIIGLKDYVEKCGFKKVVLGLSGGIDSSLVAQLAVKALGSAHVLGLLMPSEYTSRDSIDDALMLAKNLGIEIKTVAIGPIHESYASVLQQAIQQKELGTTDENIQARIRGNLLMAYSNFFGHMVLSTGNKSELSVGYCTLYGDMAGGLAVIGDLPKMQVYELSRYLNKNNEVPERVYTKAPTAELRHNQKDQDSLPPYETLDDILLLMIQNHKTDAQIVSKGYDRGVVTKIRAMIKNNEYKRRQAAPIIKVSEKSFGSGRRYPLAAKY